jgi:hypothetical protein
VPWHRNLLRKIKIRQETRIARQTRTSFCGPAVARLSQSIAPFVLPYIDVDIAVLFILGGVER